jgi:hypothetical protein
MLSFGAKARFDLGVIGKAIKAVTVGKIPRKVPLSFQGITESVAMKFRLGDVRGLFDCLLTLKKSPRKRSVSPEEPRL